MKDLLIVDCQVFQTPAWHRGMGKYSWSLLKSWIPVQKDFLEVELLFNNKLDIPKEVLSEIKSWGNNVKNVKLELKVPDIPNGDEVKDYLAYNKRVLTEYVKNKNLDARTEFLILALFIDHICTAFPENANKNLLFYDIIPFQYPKRYSQFAGFFNNFYFPRFPILFEADRVFTISRTISNDLNLYMGIDNNRLINIDGASISRAHLKETKPKNFVPKKYILMPTGDELRKNNLRCVKAYERFKQLYGQGDIALVTTSHYSDAGRKELESYSSDIIFTGNVSESELAWLYKNSEMVLFASEYEGLGLPVLEAAEYCKPIVCSDIPVFKEISETAFFFSDPTDISSIANAIYSAFVKKDWENKQKQYKAFLRKYTWEKSIAKIQKGIASPIELPSENKLKISVIAPNPNGFSAVGKVLQETHPAMSDRFMVNYFFDYGPSHVQNFRQEYLSELSRTNDASIFAAEHYRKYDATIYHIGNSDYHLNSIKNALAMPGFAILHDTFIEGAFGWLVKTGVMGINRKNAELKLNGDSKKSSYLSSLVNSQLGIIVHSEYAKKAIQELLVEDVPILKANLPVSTSTFSAQSTIKEKTTIGLAGILASIKGIKVIRNLAEDEDFFNCRFQVFGYTSGAPKSLYELAALPNVDFIKDPTDFEFQTLLSRLDILVNFRMSYHGETSLTTLEAMRYGVATIVRDIGWYSELPDDAVVKVKTSAEVKNRLQGLIVSKQLREKLGTSAQEYVRKSHSHKLYANEIANFIEQNIKKDTFNGSLARNIKLGVAKKDLIKLIKEPDIN